MKTLRSSRRYGSLNNLADIEFEFEAQVYNGTICSAQGYIFSPENAHNIFSGAIYRLTEKITGIEFIILVAPDKFLFMEGYKNINKIINYEKEIR